MRSQLGAVFSRDFSVQPGEEDHYTPVRSYLVPHLTAYYLISLGGAVIMTPLLAECVRAATSQGIIAAFDTRSNVQRDE